MKNCSALSLEMHVLFKHLADKFLSNSGYVKLTTLFLHSFSSNGTLRPGLIIPAAKASCNSSSDKSSTLLISNSLISSSFILKRSRKNFSKFISNLLDHRVRKLIINFVLNVLPFFIFLLIFF